MEPDIKSDLPLSAGPDGNSVESMGTAIPPLSLQRRVIVKLPAGGDFNIDSVLTRCLKSKVDLSSVAVHAQFGEFGTEPPEVPESLLARAKRQDRTYCRDVGLPRYFALVSKHATEIMALLEKIDSSSLEAYIEGFPEFLMCQGGRITHVIDQGYLLPAPHGIGIEYSWKLPGGDGCGMRFVDIENGWNLEDDDLVDACITLISGENIKDYEGSAAHGTMVLGIVAASDNRRKIKGIAHGVPSVRVASPMNSDHTSDLPRAIASAAAELRFGDVLLIEGQYNQGYPGFVLVEGEAAVFEAIRLATAAGVVVIEPAGNSSQNLDTIGFGREHEDSGAIVVAAASSEVPHFHLPKSNFGRRVDCYAWGDSVTTLGKVELYARRRHFSWGGYLMSNTCPDLPEGVTSVFGKTSGASAILAGVALCVQSLAQQHLGFRLSPWQLRLLLADSRNGTPSEDADCFPIGVMPDFEKIVRDTLSLTPNVYLRDYVGDIGERSVDWRFESPDIIVTEPDVENPQAKFGEDSGTENNLIGVSSVAGCKYSILVRARNRGGEDAREVKVRIYRAPAASLIPPNLWEEEVGATTLPLVCQGDLLAVSGAIPWQAPGEVAGQILHKAWIALFGSSPKPTSWSEFQEVLRSRQLACRNVHIVEHALTVDEENPTSYVNLPFIAPGAPDEDLNMRLETLACLPRQARVWLAMPPAIADLRGIWGDPPSADEGRVHVPVNPNGRHYFRASQFAAGSQATLQLVIYVPPELRSASYRISVRQLYENETVGCITWRLRPSELQASSPG